MADIKTHLRELGVAVGINLLSSGMGEKINTLTPPVFYKICCAVLGSDSVGTLKSDFNENSFDKNENDILKNSFSLAKVIVEKFKITNKDRIEWCGRSTQKGSPTDLIVGVYTFSLKEESFILENMGLYKYLSLMTGKSFDRGTHIFERFSPKEYQALFSFVWTNLIRSKKNFIYKGETYVSKITFTNSTVNLSYKDSTIYDVSKLPLDEKLSIVDFDNITTSKTREKVFSKWIKANMEGRGDYLAIKKTVSELAAATLVDYVKKNLDKTYSGLKRFLRVHDEAYYYAKSTANGVGIFKVPSSKDFAKVFMVDDVSWGVPESQVNIYTKIRNKKTGEILGLRNELRFSHGQFNGTPEAKMYYDRDGRLETIYERIA